MQYFCQFNYPIAKFACPTTAKRERNSTLPPPRIKFAFLISFFQITLPFRVLCSIMNSGDIISGRAQRVAACHAPMMSEVTTQHHSL